MTSCGKNEVELASVAPIINTNDYIVENGIIKFDNKESYLKVYNRLSTASELELKIWNNNLPFKTLKNSFDANLILESKNIKSDVDPLTPISEIKDKALYLLLNEEGVLMCGDTIVKMKDGYLFIIPNSNFESLNEISNLQDVTTFTSIFKQKLCTEIKPTIKQNPVGMQKILEHSALSYVTSTYREFVHYEANVIWPLFAPNPYLEIKLSGVGQNLFIYWQPPFAHEMDYGRVVINGSTWTDPNNKYPFSYDSAFQYNVKWVTKQLPLPSSWPNFSFDMNVDYTYKMNNLTSGQGGATINYVNTQF